MTTYVFSNGRRMTLKRPITIHQGIGYVVKYDELKHSCRVLSVTPLYWGREAVR